MSMFIVFDLKCIKFKYVKLFFAKFLKTVLIKTPKCAMSNTLLSKQDHTLGLPKQERHVTCEIWNIV